jgi:hypothetical protein
MEMMMKYILIIYLSSGYATPFSVEFNSEAACEDARDYILRDRLDKGFRWDWGYCVSKGE